MNIYFAHGDEAHETLETATNNSNSVRNIVIGVVVVLLVVAVGIYLAKRQTAKTPEPPIKEEES